MNLTKVCLSVVAALTLTQVAVALPATWSNVGSTTATGFVSGVGISASTTSTAPFDGTATHRFAHTNIPCGGWDAAGLELDPMAVALTTTWVNAGDYQQFDFDSPWSDGLFYIENFDSSSLAMIMVSGGATLELVAASPSISFDSKTSTLSTSNASFDGEGDAVLRFSGAVTSVKVDYKGGKQANGIFYTFADGQAGGGQGAIPEPTSVLIWGSLMGLMVLVHRRAVSAKRQS